MKRESGILLHVSSLPGDYGCGSFGASARAFVDIAAEAGFSCWQVLPFGPPDSFGSPYKSVSAFAGNPYFIDLPRWKEEGLLSSEELQKERSDSPYLCDFERLAARYSLFRKVAGRADGETRRKAERFIEKRPRLLEFCRFMALKEANGQKPWWEFSADAEEDEETLFMHKFLQYTFFTQWKEIRRYANKRGIRIIGDMPIYVDADSSDVYFCRDAFLLDKDGRPSQVAGVPPDYFAPEGQLWGNPLYNWKAMKKDGYTWWKERMTHTMELFDGVRIDHFRAFSSYYAIEAGAANAKNGRWHKGPGLSFVRLLQNAAKGGLIIAEDLGDIDDAVRKLVRDSGLPGMRVFQFGFDGEDDTHRPHAYPALSAAYSGTHDNNTLLGYLWELESDKKRLMLEYVGGDPDRWQEGVLPILRSILASHAALVVFPIQDLLGYGKDTRMNTPGRPDGNWRFRLTQEQLDRLDKEKFNHLNRLYGRKR